jgi:hypothetical protein
LSLPNKAQATRRLRHIDELEEQVGALPINGDIAGLINDQELGLGQ